MASAATDLLSGKVVGILESEASSIVGVRDQVDEIKQELISMKSFLKDAEGKKPQTEGGETWVASVRDLAYNVEDIIDEFMYQMHEQQSGGRFASLLRKTICFPNHWNRGRFARWLHKTIHIPNYRGRFASCLHKALHIPKKLWYRHQIESYLYIKEDELVGTEDKKQILMGWLMNGEQQQAVISVVGMGGSGKTTLVAKNLHQ
ncbi:unnamed protein product [Prunus armeniaca]